jgi:restriction system protein
MAVPDYQSLLLPLLKLAGAGLADTLIKAENILADQFALSAEDRAARLPSGQQTVLRNRAGWASFYLKHAGLIEKPRRGIFLITNRGREVLASNPSSMDVNYLLQFEDFKGWFYNFKDAYQKGQSQGADLETSPQPSDRTPDEVLQDAYQAIRSELATEILDRLLKASPEFFENVVVELLVSMGYGGSRQDAGERIGKSGDGGIDGIIKEDRLGLDVIYIQAKRWQSNVGRPEIQKFVGALQGQRAKKGVFMTTSGFSSDAVDYVSRIDVKVVLLDGSQIANLMIDHDVGVSPVTTFVIKKIDSDYFEET